jgi:hypothetical protein
MSELLWPLRIHHSIPTNHRGELGSSLDLDGVFHFWTPGVLRDRPEIGYYAHTIGVERTLEFRKLLEDAGTWDIPGVDAIYPDQPNLSIRAGDYPGAYRSVMWPMDEELPDAILPVLDAFHRLVDEASASPRRVLTGRVQWSARSFSAREPQRLELTLQSKGTERIVVRDPMAAPGRGAAVRLLVSQVQPEGVTNRQWIDVTPDMLARPDEARPHAKPPPEALIELAPGQSVRLTATTSAYLSPGEYQAVLFFETGHRSGPKGEWIDGFVAGALALELPPLRIVHR